MTQRNAFKILTAAFTAFGPKEIENIRFHLKQKTRIACGEFAHFYEIDGKG